MKTPSLWMIAAACFIAPASVAHARSAYDGSWDLVFVTQKGTCDPAYNFTVNVSDGVVNSSQSRKIQGIRREIRFGSCVGDGSRQIRFRHGQAFRNLGSRKMERPRGKCAMHGLLDRTTQLTNLESETPCPEPPTCEAALKTTALAATLLFAHGQTTERTVNAAERLGHALGVTVRVLPYWGELTVEFEGAPTLANRSRQAARRRHGQGTGRHDGDRSGLPRQIVGRGCAIRA